MKKCGVFLVTLAILLALGMAFVSCGGDDNSDPLNGTYVYNTKQLKLDNGAFTLLSDGKNVVKGTYTVGGVGNKSISLKPSHIWVEADSQWYTRQQMSVLPGMGNYNLNQWFQTGTGSIDGNKITIKWYNVSETLTKK